MFSITYKVNGYPRIEKTNDIKDLIDIAIGTFGKRVAEEKIRTIAAWMNWGDEFRSQDYTIYCHKE